jgi:hypothetical protein
MAMTFGRKSYGRFFVEKEEDIIRVKEIMREIDEYEVDNYLPSDLITVFKEGAVESVYTHKFDSMDMSKVLVECWRRGIKCFMIDTKITGYEDL